MALALSGPAIFLIVEIPCRVEGLNLQRIAGVPQR